MQDEPTGEVIRRQPNSDAVAFDHPSPVTVHVFAQFAVNLDVIIQLDTIQAAGMHFGNVTVEFDQPLL
jgi:hypothetical protein